jgi:hypothetical protein
LADESEGYRAVVVTTGGFFAVVMTVTVICAIADSVINADGVAVSVLELNKGFEGYNAVSGKWIGGVHSAICG